MMHSIRKEMFCVGVVVASCCATVRVSGANYAFPSAGGDISSAEAWNGAIPGEADSIDIFWPSDEYKITKNVTFGNIRFTGGSGLFLVDATGRDVNFTTNKNALYTYTSANETGRHITLKGGHWNLNGGEWLGIDSHNTFELRDSCMLTNISICWATMWSQSSAHLLLKNRSSIFCNEFRVGKKNFSGTVDINDGSKIIVKNNFYTDTDADGILDTFTMDSDGDGNFDTIVVDSDGDGVLDSIGQDTNADGVLDTFAADTNADGEIDQIARDTNYDGVLDTVAVDADLDGTLDVAGVDVDGDGSIDVVTHVK